MLYLSQKLKDFEMQIKYSPQIKNSFFMEKKLVENFYTDMDLRGPKLMQIPLEDRETYSKYFLSYSALSLKPGWHESLSSKCSEFLKLQTCPWKIPSLESVGKVLWGKSMSVRHRNI